MNYFSSYFYKPTSDLIQDVINTAEVDSSGGSGIFKSQHQTLYKKVMKELIVNSVNSLYPEIFQYLYGWVISKGELEYHRGNEILTIDIKNDDEYNLFTKIVSKLDNPNYYIDCVEWFIMSRTYFFVIKDRHMINLFKNNKYKSSVTRTKYFCRGFFEGSKPKIVSNTSSLTCVLSSYWVTKFFKHYIKKYFAICGESKYFYTWYDMDALTFLGDLYNRNGNVVSNVDELLGLESVVDKIQRAKSFEYRNDSGEAPQFICNKLVPEAVYPYKNSISDVGFTIKLLNLVKEEDGIDYYTTGLQFLPDYGYYFEIYGQELYKSGYMIATGGTFIVDTSSNDEVVVPLYRFRESGGNEPKQLYVKLVLKKMCLCDVKNYQSESESDSVSELKSYTIVEDVSISESNDSSDDESEST